MATIGASNLTLLDHAKRMDPNGNISVIGELLSQTNEILDDAVFKEGNLPTGERVVIRTGLPSVYWRALNQGIPSSKSSTAQVDEGCAILEARSEVDKDLAMLNGNTSAFRLSEDVAFLEAMNQAQASCMFYGNPSLNPKEFLGLSARYGDIGGGAPANAQNILDAGGTGSDNTSIWLVVWGDQTVYCPFPKGSKAGLIHQDLGEQTVYNSDGTRLQALSTLYQWKNGLVVKDWRYVVRVANVDVSDLIATATTQATTTTTNILRMMSRAIDRIPNMNMGRACFYMNRTIHSGLRLLALEKSSGVLRIEDGLNQFGTAKSWTSFCGIPLRKVDALINAEAQIL
jgi:hypothetical protein